LLEILSYRSDYDPIDEERREIHTRNFVFRKTGFPFQLSEALKHRLGENVMCKPRRFEYVEQARQDKTAFLKMVPVDTSYEVDQRTGSIRLDRTQTRVGFTQESQKMIDLV
jgi:hypothetical protein